MVCRLFPILSALAALAGACSLKVEADIPEVAITQHGVRMPGVPLAKSAEERSISTSFNFSRSNSAWAKRMNSDVLVQRLTVAQGDGLPNLDFIKLARLTMTDPATSQEATEIINYQRSEQAASSAVIDLSPDTPVDITALWTADKTVITLEMAGALPLADWVVDVTLKLTGKIRYDY
ncbi:MAG TPA: hypothetical protein VF518_15810 [Polyangia bacterium]